MATEVPTILQIAETGRAEDLYAELKDKSDSSLYYFVKVVCNYRDLTDDFHLPFCLRIEQDEDVQRSGYLLPRAHFKSTIVTKMASLWWYLKNHEERILIIGESDTVAKKNLIDVKWHIANNQLLRWLYPELKLVDPGVTKWTDAEILLPREGTYDEPSITCDGIGARRTGFHYTRIVYDDPIGDKAAQSEAVMDAAWEWMEYAPGLMHDPAKSKERWVGTRWKHGTGDVYGRAMIAMPDVKWYIRSAIENEKPTFPQRFTLSILADIRNREGDYKFNCQYMNNPTAPGGADFEAGWIQEYDVAEDGITILPCDGSPKVTTGQLLRMGMYDVSAGGKSAQCENAITVAGMACDKRIFVLESWGANCTIGQAVEKYHVLNDRWNLYKAFYELVGAQKSVEDFANERRHQPECAYCQAGHLKEGKFERNPHKRLTPIGIKPPGGQLSKEERIRLYAQKPMEEKRVYFRRGMTVLRNQVIEFPHSPMCDRFDTLAYLCNLLRAPLSDADVESYKAEDARHRVAGKPFTHTERDYGGYAA
jgi:hypothetical protein